MVRPAIRKGGWGYEDYGETLFVLMSWVRARLQRELTNRQGKYLHTLLQHQRTALHVLE